VVECYNSNPSKNGLRIRAKRWQPQNMHVHWPEIDQALMLV
jgi:hypothetical protein